MFKDIKINKLSLTLIVAFIMATALTAKPGFSSKKTFFGDAPGKSGSAPGQNKVCKNNNGIGNNYDVEYTIDGETKSIRIDPGNRGQINKFKGDLAAEGYSESDINSAVAQLVDAEMKANGSGGGDCPNVESSTDYSTMYDHLSDFSFYRGDYQPTDFHSVLDDGKTGVDVFQKFANLERKRLDLDDINARVLDPTKLNISHDADVKVYFINEGAGYRNQLKVKATGATPLDKMVFNDVSCRKHEYGTSTRTGCIIGNDNLDPEDALDLGDYVDLGTIQAGTNLDFQVLANGFGKTNPKVWHTDATDNSDKLQHVIAYEYQNYLILGWEDLNNGGDMDYNDVVFVVDIGENNLIKIPDGNTLPNAKDDSASTNANTPINIDVITGDTDEDGDDLVISTVNNQSKKKGTVSKISNNDKEVLYTPKNGFVGRDHFYYFVSDGKGGKDKGKVTVMVNNRTPNANNKTASTNSTTPVNINLIAGNSDPDGHTLSIDSVPSTTDNGGSIQVDGDSITYTPNSEATGSYSDTFDYTIVDEYDGTATATVTVNVSVNGAPVAADDKSLIPRGTSAGVDVLANDSDPEDDILTIVSVTDGANGTVEIVDGKAVYTPNSDFYGKDSFSYTVSDGQGGTGTANVNVEVSSKYAD